MNDHAPLPLAAEVRSNLQNSRSKEDTFRYLVSLSKVLPKLSDTDKTPINQIRGCESRVWLCAQQDPQGRWWFHADSDAKLLRGLMTVILSLVEGQDSQTIIAKDLPHELAQMQLSAYLTASRSNGMQAILARIQQLVRGL